VETLRVNLRGVLAWCKPAAEEWLNHESYEVALKSYNDAIAALSDTAPKADVLPAETDSPHEGKKLVIVMNHGPKMTRGKFAAQAVHAALFAFGVHPETPVVVISGSQPDIESMPIKIRDAGRTELEPGTLTAGAQWIGADERFAGQQQKE